MYVCVIKEKWFAFKIVIVIQEFTNQQIWDENRNFVMHKLNNQQLKAILLSWGNFKKSTFIESWKIIFLKIYQFDQILTLEGDLLKNPRIGGA